MPGIDGDPLARRAPAGRAHDPVAGGHIGHAGAHAFHGAGKFRGRRERERRLVLVFPRNDQRIEEVEGGGGDLDDGSPRPGGRRRDFGKFELIRRAEMGAENGFHAMTMGVARPCSGRRAAAL